MTMCAVALWYIVRGWEVFPAPPGSKRSYKAADFSNGRRWGASKHPAVIRRDWRRWPNANIGIPTGPENGFFVVEADTTLGHDVDGIASLRELEAKHETLPPTLMAQSPSGSLHYYFNYPTTGITISNSTSKIAPGIDVRGHGGMVIAPPSVKPGVGAYVWLNEAPIAAAPSWLLDMITKTATPERRPISERAQVTIRPHFSGYSKYVEAALYREREAVANAPKGQRNDQLNRSAFNLGTLVGAGALVESDAREALLDAALANGLMREDGKRACLATIKSGLESGIRQPRQIPEPKSYHGHDIDWLRKVMMGQADA